MRIVATHVTHDEVEFGPDEALPQPFDPETGHCYVEMSDYSDPKEGCRYYTRTPLVPDLQIKVWQGLIAGTTVEDLLTNDEIADSEPYYAGEVADKRKLTLNCGLVGLFKPKASDDLWTGTHWSEIAAYQVDRETGANLVPVTVHRTLAGGKEGSLQLWVDGLKTVDVTELSNNARFFDRLIANSDRLSEVGGNTTLHTSGRPVLIDNGPCFTATVTGNNAVNDLAQIKPSDGLLARVKELDVTRITALAADYLKALAERRDLLTYIVENGREPAKG